MTPEHPEALRVALEIVGLLEKLGISYHLRWAKALGLDDLLERTTSV